MTTCPALRCLLCLALVPGVDARAQRARLGSVSFPTSAGPAAQAEFVTGVLWLHSFEYDRAANAFRNAQRLEPGFVLAYWGEAMTHTHPVWNEQDPTSGREVLGRLGPSTAVRLARAPTRREGLYLEAVEALYGEGSKARRDTLYAHAMERLVREHPEDHEAKAFYALALLGQNQGVRDTTTYLRSAPYADTVFRANRSHPGAAHYLIHAYDDPFHARLGLEAARAYSGIAPDAPHAQHMTTHIFLALGMWEEVVSQNRIALHHAPRAPGHYSSWLHYGLLQQGRIGEATQLLVRLGGDLPRTAGQGPHTYRSVMRASHLLHAKEWRGGPAEWQLPHDRMAPAGQAVDAYLRGAIAFRRRNGGILAAAGAEVALLAARVEADALGAGGPEVRQVRVMARELGAMLLFLNGSRDGAVRVMREATILEDAIPLEFGPPVIVEPSHELLGTMLLEMDPKAAQLEFEKALVLAPGRALALEGLVRASVAAGDRDTARRALDSLSTVWREADPRIRDDLEVLRRTVSRMR
ncbi:MAG: hypothetical protein ACRENB_03565 [Gemmatimonadales bacterium]